MCLSYQLIIHFVVWGTSIIRRKQFISHITIPISSTKIHYVIMAAPILMQAAVYMKKNLEQKLAEEKILRKKLQKFEANQY